MDGRELLRDRYGTVIGQIGYVPGKHCDRYGYMLGWYEPSTDQTHDKYGTMIGRGHILLTLLHFE